MGRRKCYATQAERQAAYRQRLRTETVVVDRESFVRLAARLDAVHTALYRAKQAGSPLARQVYHASVDTTLEALTAWFNTCREEAN